MSNPATESMLQAVRMAKESASRAEREYDRGASMLQMRASRSVNLFGGSAVNHVADLASESKKICDSLYATYQTLVKMVDDQCRPLLDQGAEYIAAREVRDLIKWLNDESEIENNFTASLNSHDLGGVASRRYFPSIENKMIQSFWETKCDMWPGRAEAEAAAHRQKAEEEAARKRKAEEIARRQEEQESAQYVAALAAYKKEHDQWELKVSEATRARSSALNAAVEKAKETYLSSLETSYNTTYQKASNDKAAFQKQLADTEALLASLGAFKFSEKKAAKKKIQELSAKIQEASARMMTAENTYSTAKSNLNVWVNKMRSQLQPGIDKSYPIPTEPKAPRQPRRISASNPYDKYIMETILECMVPGKKYSYEDFRRANMELDELSGQKLAYFLRRLDVDGLIVKRAEKSTDYYILAD